MRMRRVWSAVLVTAVAGASLAGCTTIVTRVGPVHTIVPTPTPSPSPTAVSLEIPKRVSGELARVVFEPKPVFTLRGTIEARSKPGREYSVYVACSAANPTHTVSYDVRIHGSFSQGGTIPCDGTMAGSTELSSPHRSTYEVSFTRTPDDLLAAYGVVVPEEH